MKRICIEFITSVIAFCFWGHRTATQLPTNPSTVPNLCPEEFQPSSTFRANDFLSTNHQSNDSIIKIGVLASYKYSKLFLGAASLAVSHVNEDRTLLKGRRLILRMEDVGNSGSEAQAALSIRRMTQMRDEGVIAFIGPDDNCANEALVAAAWNMPMISYKCADKQVSNKTKFYTFARTLPPSSKVVKALVSLLNHFQWKKFVLLTEGTSGYLQIGTAFKSLATHHRLRVTAEHFIPHNYTTLAFSTVKEIIRDTLALTRIYVILASFEVQWDFMLALNQATDNRLKEYAVIAFDDDNYENASIHFQKLRIPGKSDNRIYDFHLINSTFHALIKVAPASSYMANREFEVQIKQRLNMAPVCLSVPQDILDHIQVPIFGVHLYDAITVYARALSKVLLSEKDPRNGSSIIEYIRGKVFPSVQGVNVSFDANADAEGSYMTLSIGSSGSPDQRELGWRQVGSFVYGEQGEKKETWQNVPVFKLTKPIHWLGLEPPRDEPPCGFEGCKTDWKPLVGGAAISVILTLVVFLLLRHLSYDRKLAKLLWQIDFREFTEIPTERPSRVAAGHSKVRVYRQSMFTVNGTIHNNKLGSETPRVAFCKIGLFKGNIVAIKRLKKSVDITTNIKKQLTKLRELRHENLIAFVGAAVDNAGVLTILTAYCARGSLKDVLVDPDVQLDRLFIASLIADLIKGMIYLHDSDIVYHGSLRSSNCLVDSRWVLQIADFGLWVFKGQEGTIPPDNKLYWSPEQMRSSFAQLKSPQKMDVYAFGLILYEVVGRNGPWGTHGLRYSKEDIIFRVCNATDPPFRPPLERSELPEHVLRCLGECWLENPDERPDMKCIRFRLKEMQAGLKLNIVDNMLAMLEKHAYNLEGKVEERTNQLMEEKKKTEALLLRMLPKSVAEALKRGERVPAESYENVTIYFSDIVGFTTLSAKSTPMQIVDMLNELYTRFDAIIGDFDVYKVETIGDAYMVVSGLPIKNGDIHATEIATMALKLLQAAKHFPLRHRPGETLKLRIGVHSGSCVAGVVGLTMPRYCLFGDTVNTAFRMESTGEPLRIHISEAHKLLLDRKGGYIVTKRGPTTIKGKGLMITWWLEGVDTSKSLNTNSVTENRNLINGQDTCHLQVAADYESDHSSRSSISRRSTTSIQHQIT